MCFNLQSKNQQAIVADRDIKVYKTDGKKILFGLGFVPEYKSHFTYWLNCKTKKLFVKPWNVHDDCLHHGEIYEGYHAYDHLGLGKEWRGYMFRDANEKKVVYEFIIPKGTRYYENTNDGTVVADQLIYKGSSIVSKDWLKRCVDIFQQHKSYLEHEPGDS